MKLRHGLASTLLVLLLGFVAPPGSGAGKRVPVTNGELVEGERDRLEIADNKMNAAYQKLLGILDNEDKAVLREAQRKWVAWRDAQAQFDAHQLKGGKLWQMELSGSKAGLTERRTTELQENYERFKS